MSANTKYTREYYKTLSIEGYKLRTELEFWKDMSNQEMRLRCGELSCQEIRSIRAVLSLILSQN